MQQRVLGVAIAVKDLASSRFALAVECFAALWVSVHAIAVLKGLQGPVD